MAFSRLPAQSAVIIQEVVARDIGQRFLAVPAAAQLVEDLRHIGRALAVHRRGFNAVKIAAEADVLLRAELPQGQAFSKISVR